MPFLPQQERTNINIENQNNNNFTVSGQVPQFDFETNEFNIVDGKIVLVQDLEGLKVWIRKIFKTIENKYPIYIKKDEYGITDLQELICGPYPYSYKKSEIERITKETLKRNTAIKAVQNFKFERNGRKLNVSFDVYTIFGNYTEGVTI